jgi:ribosomal protein S18 acetylase RimI-like enzyme
MSLMLVRRIGPGEEAIVLGAPELFDEILEPAGVRAYLGDDRNMFLMAFEDGAAIGFLRGTEMDQLKSERRQMFLYEIEVAERFRRQGVARALISTFLSYCRERRFEEAFVFTDPSNTAAVGLYVSTGGLTETPADRMYVYRL